MKMTTQEFLDHLGIEVGKEFKIKAKRCEELTFKIDNGRFGLDLFVRDDDDDKAWVISSYQIGWLLDKEIIQLPKYTLTEDEKAIVRNIDDKWKWIHRTNEEIMFISTCSADFNSKNKTWNYDGGHYFNRFPYAEKVFNFIGFGCSVSLDELRKCL